MARCEAASTAAKASEPVASRATRRVAAVRTRVAVKTRATAAASRKTRAGDWLTCVVLPGTNTPWV